MPQPTLCMVHDTIGLQSGIAKTAMWGVKEALQAGWDVTVIAEDLDHHLIGDVKWIKLNKVPRIHLAQWLSARLVFQKALGKRTFDILHVHQPQLAALADVMQCHFLTRVAFERNCLERRSGLKPMIVRGQQQGVLYAEDYYYRRREPATEMLFCSELLRDEFHRLYGQPAREEVLVIECPPINFPTVEERLVARRSLLGGDYSGTVVGYLGGVDERKGYRNLIKALENSDETFLLMGGPNSAMFSASSLGNRFRSVGMVKDLKTFFAACDVFLVPSYFDPCPRVAFEAAVNGVPVIATRGVGNLPTLEKYGAGVEWKIDTALVPLIREVTSRLISFNEGAKKMSTELSERRQGERLLAVYERALNRERARQMQ